MMCNRSLIIAIVAGEKSGDMLGAGLIQALKNRMSNIHFVGIAGPLMKTAGCEAWYEVEELAVMGITEVFLKLYRILHIRADLIRRFTDLKPDVFIGIDSPDFNLNLEYNLKRKGIKIIHYVSPSIWAWRQKRIFKVGKSTHMVLTLLPFEKKFYDKYNIPCHFVGHTIADTIPLNPDKNLARDALNIPQNVRCLALLPGSREMEIKMLGATFLKTAQILSQVYPDLQVIVPLVSDKHRKQFENIRAHVTPNFQVHLLNGQSIEVMIASDAALLASGTATLECMLAKCPMVVGYRMKSFTFWLVKYLIKTDNISLPNLLSGRKLVKEFLQEECKPQALADALLPLLALDKISQETYKTFQKLHKQIRCNANERVADIVLKLANE